MRRTILFMAPGLLSLCFFSCEKAEEIINAPKVITGEASSITMTTAQCGGEITDDGGAPISACGICYGTCEWPDLTGTSTKDSCLSGSFSSLLTNLQENTTYYFRAYAINSADTAFGEQKTFVTPIDTTPTIFTAEVENITKSSVTCGGNITTDKGKTIIDRGVCWGSHPAPIAKEARTFDGTGIGSFTSQITGLLANTGYYVRAFAISSEDTIYGNEIHFITLPLDTCNLTMITNEGFLVQAGNKKIMIDALVRDDCFNFPDETKGAAINAGIIAGEAPFDNINLLLVTHAHSDHFVASKVASFLTKHTETHFVAPVNCIDSLRAQPNYSSYSERVHRIQLTVSKYQCDTINGIPLTTMYTNGHGIHYSYYFKANDIQCYHSGDNYTSKNITLIKNALKDKFIDIHFEGFELNSSLDNEKGTRYFVPMHYNPIWSTTTTSTTNGLTLLYFNKHVETKTLHFE